MTTVSSLRVVLDTNVLISGLLSQSGAPALLVRAVVRTGQAVFSDDTFAEFKSLIWRPKFDRFITIEQRNAVLSGFEATAYWVKVPLSLSANRYSRDLKDDMFVHAALAADAAYLVSGDDDLLCLNPIGSLPVLSPRAALDQITFI